MWNNCQRVFKNMERSLLISWPLKLTHGRAVGSGSAAKKARIDVFDPTDTQG